MKLTNLMALLAILLLTVPYESKAEEDNHFEYDFPELYLWEDEEEHDFELLLGQWSRHQLKGEFNEVHELIGFEYQDYGYATFVNSDGDRAHMIGYSPEYYENSYIELGVTYGLVHGYEKIEVFPMVIPNMTLKYKDFPVKLDVNYVPLVVLTAGFRVSF